MRRAAWGFMRGGGSGLWRGTAVLVKMEQGIALPLDDKSNAMNVFPCSSRLQASDK
jgi:hypothetical protein